MHIYVGVALTVVYDMYVCTYMSAHTYVCMYVLYLLCVYQYTVLGRRCNVYTVWDEECILGSRITHLRTC